MPSSRATPAANNASTSPSTAPARASASTSNPRTSPTGIVPALQNVVATFDLACHVDLTTVANHARNAEYNRKRFAAAIVRIRDPKTTALIFASGKVVVTGAKSEDDSKLASRKYARIVQKLGFEARFKDWKIQNMVGSADSKMLIRLEGIRAGPHSPFAMYEPETFPGLVYRMENVMGNKVVLLVFAKGKVVITGAKTREQLYEAWENIYPTLTEYRIAR